MRSLAKISLRKATFPDVEFLWYLRNQPDVYKYLKNNQSVNWKEHIDWIIPIISGTSVRIIYIIQKSGIPIGQIRIDYQTSDIGISILKEFRTSGIATKSLDLAIKKARRQKKVDFFIAKIHKKNLPSIKLFKKLGFKLKTKRGNWLKYILEL